MIPVADIVKYGGPMLAKGAAFSARHVANGNVPISIINLKYATAGVFGLMGLSSMWPKRGGDGPSRRSRQFYFRRRWKPSALGKGGGDQYKVYSLYPFFKELKYFKY